MMLFLNNYDVVKYCSSALELDNYRYLFHTCVQNRVRYYVFTPFVIISVYIAYVYVTGTYDVTSLKGRDGVIERKECKENKRGKEGRYVGKDRGSEIETER